MLLKNILATQRFTATEGSGNVFRRLYKSKVTSLKIPFSDLPFNYKKHFPENLRNISETKRESIHQDIKKMEYKKQGKWRMNMLVEGCWMLQHQSSEASYN
ncbi:hypothetical protein TNCT_312461 [Trichonephila clavata]|uniref:Uncharacterized protein n=1 Tax=Trichonephila clavata TaxID=2740835 RepID=A0A8X6GF82_TRICU|nr:hypothetical protein TNCT_312461 [Trichonephila clavata]